MDDTKKDLVIEVVQEDEVTTKQFTKPKYSYKNKRTSKTVRDAKIVNLHLKGNTKTDIAKVVGTKPETVTRVLSKFNDAFKELDNVKEYQEVRKDLLNAAELTLLKSVVDPETVAKAPLGQRAFALDKVHTARRLEEGKSTANTATIHKFTIANVETVDDADEN